MLARLITLFVTLLVSAQYTTGSATTVHTTSTKPVVLPEVIIEYNEPEYVKEELLYDELEYLAACVEAEAGYYEGHELSQQYITQVILNRLHSGQFPNSVEEVIYQKTNGCPQFSVAYNGMMDDREVEPETLANVYSVLVHGTDLPEYVLYFYSASVTENWVNTLNTYTTESGTVFAYESKEVY